MMTASFVETAVKDFFAASKFLRRTLDAPKLDRKEYVDRLGELAKKYNELTADKQSSLGDDLSVPHRDPAGRCARDIVAVCHDDQRSELIAPDAA